MTYLDRAIKDGYAIITGPENKQKIIYVTSDNHTENYNDPEEKVRAEFWAELIYEYDYPAHRIKVEVTIPDRVPTDRADIVIFSDDECKKPYAVVECKRDGVTDAEFLQAIEQGVGNATWVKLRASYVVIIAGATRRVLDFSDDSTGILERENNIIADLPKAYGKPQAFRFYRGGEYTDVDGKKKKAPDIQPVAREDLITAIKKCHNTLWGGGRLSPPTAFGELCKLIFVKISDEQKPRKKGEPYQFQIKTHEPSSKLAKRINDLYNEQKVKDPEVFTDSIKVDDRVLRTVVSHLEAMNLSKTDLDVKGVAFEQFMDGFFKGDFGQYFTPRPIIEFAVKMMKPQHDWDVLDPACGSGGFLLHALDFMRTKAADYFDPGTVEYYNYWHEFASKHLFGIEINDEIARVAKMNMIVHDDGHTNVISFDALDSIEKMHYSPRFVSFRNQIEQSRFPAIPVGEISEKIVSGFAAGKQDQADDLPEDQRVPHLRPFSITPEGELSFETKKYVPKSRLKSEDYCKKNEVIFNNTNSPDLVGKTTVFDSDVLCAASNHMTRITVKKGVNPYYVAAFFNVLLSIGYWKLLCTNFNNQAGVNTDTLKRVKIPLPPKEIQDQIAAELMQRRSQANVLRRQAIKEWADAKAQFEKELLGE